MKPFFELEGKRYEITRTRHIDVEYEKIRNEDNFTKEQEQQIAKIAKLKSEYEELADRFNIAKENYFNDILSEEKKSIYLAFKELIDEKYIEYTNYEINHKDTSQIELQNLSLRKGEKLLILALAEQYFNGNFDDAKNTWEKYVDIIGIQKASEWIVYMLENLFNNEEDDPFLRRAKELETQKAEMRKGLSKIKK